MSSSQNVPNQPRNEHEQEDLKKKYLEQYNDMQNHLNDPESKKIIESVQNEDIVMFIGNTKSGKSTLVNFIIGNELKAVKKKLSSSLSIMKMNDEDEGPVISLESVSETNLPTVWSAKKSGFREKVVDAPGFEDNRGEAQDIANAFYNREIMRNVRSAKFVLVADIHDIINDNINSFINFFEKIHNIFPDPSVLFGGVVLAFCKVSNEINCDDVCEFLENSILKKKKLKLPNKSFIKYFLHNKEYIEIVNKPDSEGIVNRRQIGGSLFDTIENKLTGIDAGMLANVQPGISDKSRVLLLLLHAEFGSVPEYLQMLENIKEGFMRKSNAVHENKCRDEVNKVDEILHQFEKKIQKLTTKDERLNISRILERVMELGDICGLESICENKTIPLKLQFVEFLDETLGLNNCDIYREALNATLKGITYELHLARLLVRTQLGKITAEESEREKEELQEKYEEEMRECKENVEKIVKVNQKLASEKLQKMDVLKGIGTGIGVGISIAVAVAALIIFKVPAPI